ncbi:MAG: hypothetical protein ABEL04_06530 [Salinibacter sp.]
MDRSQRLALFGAFAAARTGFLSGFDAIVISGGERCSGSGA